jgi:hypothetical protein
VHGSDESCDRHADNRADVYREFAHPLIVPRSALSRRRSLSVN